MDEKANQYRSWKAVAWILKANYCYKRIPERDGVYVCMLVYVQQYSRCFVKNPNSVLIGPIN